MSFYNKFSRHLSKIKPSTNGNYVALCPFHNDRNPSFSFNEHTGLWQCFACGEKGNIYQFLKKVGDSFEEVAIVEKKEKEVKSITTYKYFDLSGNYLYDKIRFDYVDGTKTFKIDWKTDKKTLIFYNLLDLRIQKGNYTKVFFTEGEKCTERLKQAVSEADIDAVVIGYSNVKQEIENSHIEPFLKDKVVYLFVDNDEAGEKKASEIRDWLRKTDIQTLYEVRFRNYEKGFDIADFLIENSIHDALLLAEKVYQREQLIIDFDTLLDTELPKREFISETFGIPRGILGLIAGIGSVGKGYFVLSLLIDFVIDGYNVLYLSGEDDGLEIQRRLKHLLIKKNYQGNQKGTFTFRNVSPDEDIVNITKKHIKNTDVIVIDPIGVFVKDENNPSIVSPFMRSLQYLCTTYNKNIFLVHHLRKYAQINNKWEALDGIRGSGAFHNNSRYILYVKRKKDDESVLEVWNIKNSYWHTNNDYYIENIFSEPEFDFKGNLINPVKYEKIENTKEPKKKKEKEKEKEKEIIVVNDEEIDF